jgi:uncharacterized repeat protein (TIGR03803 family)
MFEGRIEMANRNMQFLRASLPARTGSWAIALALFLTPVVTQWAEAQSYNIIHNFTGGRDGAYPLGGVTKDNAGNFYGTTYIGGIPNRYCYPSGCGVVYKLSSKRQGRTLTPLYSFAGGKDGALLFSRVVIGTNGTLYGTTGTGGRGDCDVNSLIGCGTVFNLQPPSISTPGGNSWNKTALYLFRGAGDGGEPGFGDLTLDRQGNLYGTTEIGGTYGEGAVFKLTPTNGGWTESVIYNFTGGTDGAIPLENVVFDRSGNLYGTAQGGTYGFGTVFQLTPSAPEWTITVLHAFQNLNDGLYPLGVAFHSGNLYGITGGTSQQDGGSVYELTQSGGSWTFNTLYRFNGTIGGEGTGPTMDPAGNLYGLLDNSGPNYYGSIFELTLSNGRWRYIDLHDFNGGTNDGCNPSGTVTLDSHGNLYGTAQGCGAHREGVIWELTP